MEPGLDRFRRAAELDPGDTVSLIQIGELLDERQDFAGAEAAYRRAADVEPSGDLSARIAAVMEKAREARLPAEFQAMARVGQMSRGDLAVLFGIGLEDILRDAPERDVVVTDTQGYCGRPPGLPRWHGRGS